MTPKAVSEAERLRGHYAVTTVTTRSPRGHYGHYADTTVTTRSLRGHYVVINDSKSGLAITSQSLRGHFAVINDSKKRS